MHNLVKCIRGMTSAEKHSVLDEVLEQIRRVQEASKDGTGEVHYIEYALTSWKFNFTYFKECLLCIET